MSMLSRGLRLAVSSAGVTKAGVVASYLNILNTGHGQIYHFSADAGGSNASASPTALSKEGIEKLVKNNKVVVFMKGIPDEPRCGFSNAVVQILRMHGVSKYDSHDVLKDEGIRQGIKDYTSWPTIPQVFINGDFVGGCDIMVQMHQNGDLVKELEKAGIKSALVDPDTSATEKK